MAYFKLSAFPNNFGLRFNLRSFPGGHVFSTWRKKCFAPPKSGCVCTLEAVFTMEFATKFAEYLVWKYERSEMFDYKVVKIYSYFCFQCKMFQNVKCGNM